MESGAASGDGGLDAGDAKAGGLKKRANFLRIVALEFDLALSNGATATAGLASLTGEAVDVVSGDLRLEIINDNHGLSSALSFLASQNHTAVFARWLRFFFRENVGSLGQAVELKAREGRLERALLAGGIDAGFHQGAKNGGSR